MSKYKPKITVLMPVYNGEIYLHQAIESILCQTYQDFEFVIINDKSTDNTKDILNSFAAKDSRIVVYENETNLGITKSLNKGLKVARGEYIARMDDDDISLPQRFTKQIDYLERYPNVVLVSGAYDIIDDNGKFIGTINRSCSPGLVAWLLLFCNYVGGHSQVMFRRNAVLESGGYSEKDLHNEDYGLWCRLVEIGKIVILPEKMHLYRYNAESISRKNFSVQLETTTAIAADQIKSLTGIQPPLSDVGDFRDFFLSTEGWTKYPKAYRAPNLNFQLWLIYKAFLKKHSQNDILNPNIAMQLRVLISDRFCNWLASMSVSRTPLEFIKIFICALQWNFVVAMKFALKTIRKRVQHVLF